MARDAMETARKTGLLSQIRENWRKIDPIGMIFENNRTRGFPLCTYDRKSIYWDLHGFIERNKDTKDSERKKDVERAKKIIVQYEKDK